MDETDATRTSLGPPDAGETRMSTPPSGQHSGTTTTTGWLSSSGSIDHGRFSPGTLLDSRYRILGLLGRGGMGEVYRADDLRLGQQVALKFLPESLAHDTIRLAQFHNEVRTARQVSHPNVCRVYDIGEIDTPPVPGAPGSGQAQLFLTMEYVDGEDLSSLLRRIGRLPEDKAVDIARQICAGLAAAHERGVLHRDLKPANVMLDGAGKVRLMDFGLASIGVVTDIRAGTPAYMAPEQLSGKEVTVKSDIYALGLVLYELFTGRRAFDAKNLADLVEQHQTGTFTAPTEIVRSLDASIERAIMRCLDDDPACRPSSPLAVSAALPGGDPLAAALAAGETPSPEMVAAAGTVNATMTPVAATGWAVAIVALVLVIAGIHDHESILARVPFSKPLAVLADRAETIRESLGYTEPFVESANGLLSNDAYIDWAADHGSRETHWAELASARPAVVRFWYRTSPLVFTPVNRGGAGISMSDPPVQLHGMTQVLLDTKGRLLRFEAAPPQVELPAKSGESATSVDWERLFAAAEIDRRTFAEVAPGRTPATFADERRAWQGTLPETKIPVRIEAAGYHGRAVFFDIVGPWYGASREPDDPSSSPSNNNSPIFVFALLVGAVVAARANLKSGRADKRGAFRLAAFSFFIILAEYVVGFHSSQVNDEQQRMFIRIGISLFIGAVMYLIYLGLEPFVRRNWPTMMVGWSRVLAGRLRDPLVGRDIVIGTAAGAALACLNLATDVLRPAHWPSAMPLSVDLGAVTNARLFVLALLSAMNSGLQNGLITLFEFVGFTLVVGLVAKYAFAPVARPLGVNIDRWTPTRANANRIFVVLAVVAVTVTSSWGSPSSERWGLVVYQAVSTSLTLILLLRIGMFASIIMSFANIVLLSAPLTLTGSRIYATESLTAMLIVGALAAYGLWQARSGEPLFRARV